MYLYFQNYYKTAPFMIIILFLVMNIACSSDDDVALPEFKNTLLAENFSESTDQEIANTTGWINIAQVGTQLWTEQVYSNNGYVAFSAYNSGEILNIAWFISPPIAMNMYENEKLFFQTAHNYVTSTTNTLEVLISNNFDGANVNDASWELLPAAVANPNTPRFTWVNSGVIDLSKYNGTIRIAFRAIGSGTNTALDGTFQLDNIHIYQ